MKIKSILQLKNRLDRVTDFKEIGDDDARALQARYDVYEEKIEITDEDTGATVYMTVTEAKRLQNLFKDLL